MCGNRSHSQGICLSRVFGVPIVSFGLPFRFTLSQHTKNPPEVVAFARLAGARLPMPYSYGGDQAKGLLPGWLTWLLLTWALLLSWGACLLWSLWGTAGGWLLARLLLWGFLLLLFRVCHVSSLLTCW